jgi:hypothetical protein
MRNTPRSNRARELQFSTENSRIAANAMLIEKRKGAV